MADDLHAIADLIGDAFDLAPFELNDVLQETPFLNLLGMLPSSNSTVHSYVKQTGAPVVGFRAPNAGRDMDTSDDTKVDITLKLLDFSWSCDQAIASAWRKGPEHYIAREGRRSLRAAFKKTEVQLINGTTGTGDAAGFTGFRQATTVDALADAMVVNAAGTTPATGSSVWGIRVADDGIQGVYKGTGSAIELGDTVTQQTIVNAGTDNKTFPTWYTPGTFWVGLQIGGIYDIGRICNLTADSGKGLTDLLMSQLLEKYPVGFGPTHFLMSRRSRGQLQRSRTTYSPTGQPAPLPTEYEGIPIVVTDSQSDTEALVT